MKPRLSWILPALGAIACAQPALSTAADYPDKPIRIIVGFPPSGGADIFARMVGDKLSKAWGQPVVVDNRPGASSTIGSTIAANSAPDGYTLMVVSASYSTSAGLYKNLKFDPIKSFAPVILFTQNPNALLANPAVRANTVKELIDFAKANPNKLAMGSAGTGSITDLAGKLFTSMAGIKVTHVPYRGGGPNLTGLLGGEIQITVASVPSSLGHIKAGRIKALGVTSAKRSSALPKVPTIAETVPGYEANNWYAMLAPAGTPRAIITKLNGEINRILTDPEFAKAAAKLGGEIEGGSPEHFGKFLASEIAKWKKVIDAEGMTVH